MYCRERSVFSESPELAFCAKTCGLDKTKTENKMLINNILSESTFGIVLYFFIV